MIFISHTYKDKPIVEPIALRLASVYGADKVFYDSWSIQPGDGIIDKMCEGLSTCKFFFFFVSKNSLQSKMVSLEWQNSLLKATRGEIRLIPVKLDDCLMPAILLQSLYIDIYGNGLEIGIRQMIDVINGASTFRPNFQTFENIRGYVTKKADSKYEVEFKAEYYLEPISQYGILLDNNFENIDIKCLSDGMYNGNRKAIELNNGEKHNCFFIGVSRGTAPGFPFRIELSTRNNEPIVFGGLMHAKNEHYFAVIPYKIN